MSQIDKDIEFIKATASDVLQRDHLKLVFETYYTLFREVCTGCPSRIAGYINRLKKYKISIVMEEKKKSNFILKKERLIIFKGEIATYSNANLTDEVAIKFLKGNKNRKALFAKLPKNIDELLSNKEIQEKKHNASVTTGKKKTARRQVDNK